MRDLISRSAVLKEIKLQKSYAGEMRQQSYRTGFIISLSMLEGKTAEIPAVDAEHVRHGVWVEKCMSPNMLSVWECSECNLKFDGKTWPYCPNCGARMDVEVT